MENECLVPIGVEQARFCAVHEAIADGEVVDIIDIDRDGSSAGQLAIVSLDNQVVHTLAFKIESPRRVDFPRQNTKGNWSAAIRGFAQRVFKRIIFLVSGWSISNGRRYHSIFVDVKGIICRERWNFVDIVYNDGDDGADDYDNPL